MPSTATKKAKKSKINLPIPMLKPIFTSDYYCTQKINGGLCYKTPAAATCKLGNCLIPVKKNGHPVDEAMWECKAICKSCFEKKKAKNIKK